LKGGRDADPRQQTLRATIAWSYDLLQEEEQRLFRALSVFSGGCTLEAAEEVAEADLDTLQSLVEKSLLRFSNQRYWMLETIREYAGERLDEAGEAERLTREFVAWFVEWAEEAAPHLRGPQQADGLRRVDAEYENLRTALALALEIQDDDAVRLGGALRRYWWARSYLKEGRDWLEQLVPLARSAGGEAAVWVMTGAGALAREQGDWETAIARSEEALRLAQPLGNVNVIAGCHHELGINFDVSQTDYERARISYEEALRLRRQIGDLVGVAQTLNGMAGVAMAADEVGLARERLSEALDVARELGDKELIGGTLATLALLSFDEGGTNVDLQWVRSALRESLELVLETGNQIFVCGSLEGLARVEHSVGNEIFAVRLLGGAAALRLRIGAPMMPEDQPAFDTVTAELRDALGGEQFDLVWEESQSVAVEKIIVEALGEDAAVLDPSADRA
jgi:tetratricopeptide (TPR) repeat protein